jgi:hypothetical protein
VLFPSILNLAAHRRYGPGESRVNQSGLKFCVLLLLVFAFLTTAVAQFPNQSTISPKLAVYGGFSGYNLGGKSSGIDLGKLRGWNSGLDLQFTRRYSFLADYGHYANANTGSTQTYLFGPRFTFHAKALAPFAEVMMGFQRIGANHLPRYTAFSEAIGGGLDVAIARRFSLRLFQADFVYAADHEKTHLNLNQFYGVRVSTGIVWRISKKRPSVAATEKPVPAPKSETATAKPEKKPAPESRKEKKPEVVEETKTELPATETAPVAEEKKPEVLDSAFASSEAEKEKPAQPQPEDVKAEAATQNPTATPVVEPAKFEPVEAPAAAPKPEPSNPLSTASSTAKKDLAPQNVGTLRFPYEQHATYLSPQDKRTLDAVASRLKLEPESTVAIIGASPRWAGPKAAGQRAVNSKDYLVKKGIAAARLKVFALPSAPPKSKAPPKTELIFIPAGQSFSAASATLVDEQRVKPEHAHIEHPEWREK